MKTFVVGDIHGAHKALVQCLERSKFDKENDKLIVIGDVVDRYPDTKEVVEELLTIKNLVAILGNHDDWFFKFIFDDKKPEQWVMQGGSATIASYGNDTDLINNHFLNYFNLCLPWYEDNNRLFIHGGITSKEQLKDPDFLMWDRTLYSYALSTLDKKQDKFLGYDKIFIGHTPTIAANRYNKSIENNYTKPIISSSIYLIDTGAGYNGKLTIMDIDSDEYWQSDLVTNLYN